METQSDLPSPAAHQDQFRWLDAVSSILDNRFRIPFTNIRFGVDFVIGLVPYFGDLISFALSSVLLIAMVRHGVGGKVVLIMLWNILLDTVVGGIPILGDLFDLQYRANRRNFALLKAHYQEGKHQGSAWPIILLILAVLMVLFFLLLWGLWKLVTWTGQLLLDN